MSRTKRMYNNPKNSLYKRLTKFDYRTIYIPDYKTCKIGLTYSQICMGHCPLCKDGKIEQKLKTNKRKSIHSIIKYIINRKKYLLILNF